MAKTKRMVCIRCPVSCLMEVTYTRNKLLRVKATQCPKGKKYALRELFDPVRILTSTVYVKNGHLPLVSIRTDKPIPKAKIFDVMAKLSRTKVSAPLKIGDIIIKNVVNTGVNIIATKNIRKI
ncbi:MAG: DUF1667 domain-containing protein [Thermoplasmata archaeon]|nr:DUF1667 domain-containing protein [Thermoplasmata archaeon]